MAPARKVFLPEKNRIFNSEMRLRSRNLSRNFSSQNVRHSNGKYPRLVVTTYTGRGRSKGDSKKGNSTINTIPDEILLHVLSFVPHIDLIRSAAPVSKRMARLVQLPHIWRRLWIKGAVNLTEEPGSGDKEENILTTSEASTLIEKAAPYLRELVLIERADASSLLSFASCRCNLTSLVLRRIHGPMPAFVLNRILRRFGNLRKLVMRDVRRHRSMTFFRQIGLRLPHLSILDVGHCPQFGTAALAAVANSGLSLKELRAYREDGYFSSMPHATDEDFSLFCERMKDSITVIKINASSLTDEACTALVQCVHIQTLHLRSATNITGRGILKISIALKKITSLDLSGAFLVPSDFWMEAFEKMVAGPRMEILILGGCTAIDDYAAWIIGKRFGSLQRLVLADCFLIGEFGCKAIISGCQRLRYLNMKGLTQNILPSLNLLPSLNPRLEVLIHEIEEYELSEDWLKMRKLKILKEDEPKRWTFWRNIAITEELRRLTEIQNISL